MFVIGIAALIAWGALAAAKRVLADNRR